MDDGMVSDKILLNLHLPKDSCAVEQSAIENILVDVTIKQFSYCQHLHVSRPKHQQNYR